MVARGYEAEAALKENVVLDVEDARTFYKLGKDARDWKVALAQEDVRRGSGQISPVLYRPFDRRFTYYTGKTRGFIGQPCTRVMRHMLAGMNLGLSTPRGTEVIGEWEHVFASKHLIQHHTVSLKEVNYLFPLYAYPTEGQARIHISREANLDPDFVKAFGFGINLKFTPDGVGDLDTTFGPEDVFHYIYALLHSPEYRRRYADFLKSDFPRVPLTGNRALFAALVALGKRLTDLHLMEAEGDDSPAFPMVGDNRVDKVRYAPPKNGALGQVFINRDQHFKGVTPETWEFTIGGYRPAEKWLKDRKGRVLSDDDIEHYQKIVAALADTQCLMDETDELIEQHGGWPDAFQ